MVGGTGGESKRTWTIKPPGRNQDGWQAYHGMRKRALHKRKKEIKHTVRPIYRCKYQRKGIYKSVGWVIMEDEARPSPVRLLTNIRPYMGVSHWMEDIKSKSAYSGVNLYDSESRKI